MKKNRHKIFSVVFVFIVAFFLGCQSNGVKETVQRDLNDLQKQIFELQQDQAYINTKIEQTSLELTQVSERLVEKEKELDEIIQSHAKIENTIKNVHKEKTERPKGTSKPKKTPQTQKVAAVTSPPVKNQKGPPKNSRELYKQGLDLVRSGKIDAAIPYLAKYIELYPRTELADNALYWLGECYYKKREFNQAVNKFKKVITDYPSGNKVPSALLKMGYAYVELRQTTQALESLQKIINQYPNDPTFSLAQKKIDIILSER